MAVDLSTTYLGFRLPHPVVPSSSPLTGDLDHLHELVAAGAPAVVLPSLFEEQIEHEEMAIHHGIEFGAEHYAEAAGGYFPEMDEYNAGPVDYLSLVHAAKRELPIPVIASLNGSTKGGWTLYAKILEDAGVDALELNIYLIEADVTVSADEVERQYLELVESVRKSVAVPLAVKIGPYFSSLGHMARRLTAAGADGLVLFNRFYQPDIDLARLEVVPNLVLSTPAELRLVLRWMAILAGRVECDLAATTGLHTAEEAIKLVLAGADVTMMASALLRNGPGRLREVVDGLGTWLEEGGYRSLEQAKGSLSQVSVPDPTAFERANYMRTLVSYSSDWHAGLLPGG
jgi:dihydroorotate dehydrogenase (fumarate)